MDDRVQQVKTTEAPVGPPAPQLPLYGDVLDAVVRHVAALDLVPASRVSREWRRAVRSASSSRLAPPWLLLHRLKNPPPRPRRRSSSSYAFDPHSRTWLPLPPPLPGRDRDRDHVNKYNNNNNNTTTTDDDGNSYDLFLPVVACEGARLCALSLSAMSVSADPFGASAWRHFDAPRVWRQDPVVALVGPHVAVLGGACELALGEGDDASSVEVLTLRAAAVPAGREYHSNISDRTSTDRRRSPTSSCWRRCEPIPAAFYGSASALWLSAAASERRVYVVERTTGWASWFDPETRRWGPVRQLRPDGSSDVSAWAVGCAGAGERDGRLILIGVSGIKKRNGMRVKVWEVEGDELEVGRELQEEMPREMAERLFLNIQEEDRESEEEECSWRPWSIGLCASGDYGYVYNRSEPRKGMAMYQVAARRRTGARTAGMIRRWEWVPCPAVLEQDYYHHTADKVTFGCSAVGLDDLAALARLRAPRNN